MSKFPESHEPELLDKILQRIDTAEQILIFGHVSPDGDAIGSALGLMWLLRALGKETQVSFADPLPVALEFLPGSEEVLDRPLDRHDLVIALDGSDAERYGDHFTTARNCGTFIITIDHHRTNTFFADLNWVDSRFAATAEMIYHLARHAGWSLPEEVATCLATGCVTDTNAFSTDHTTPAMLETVADLMRHGAPLAQIMRHAIHLRTQEDVLLWGRVLSTLQIKDDLAWAVSRKTDRDTIGAEERDGSGIATFLRNIIGVKIGILFVEVDPGSVRISMRSRPGFDVSQLAFELGGGGHKQAAGVTVEGPLDEVVALVLEKAETIVRKTVPARTG